MELKKLAKRILGLDYKSKCVREVLTAFKQMGASKEDLANEKAKLEQDEMYLAEWSIAVNPERHIG